uniref:Uncharacterized protein n=1 Tax=Arundo donax TaxID=35708 RepID=A0A0A9BBK3_ARUDO
MVTAGKNNFDKMFAMKGKRSRSKKCPKQEESNSKPLLASCCFFCSLPP